MLAAMADMGNPTIKTINPTHNYYPPPGAGDLGDHSVSKKTLHEHHGQQQNQTKLQAVKSEGGFNDLIDLTGG